MCYLPREFCALSHAAGFSTAIYRHTRSAVQLLVNSLDVFPKQNPFFASAGHERTLASEESISFEPTV